MLIAINYCINFHCFIKIKLLSRISNVYYLKKITGYAKLTFCVCIMSLIFLSTRLRNLWTQRFELRYQFSICSHFLLNWLHTFLSLSWFGLFDQQRGDLMHNNRDVPHRGLLRIRFSRDVVYFFFTLSNWLTFTRRGWENNILRASLHAFSTIDFSRCWLAIFLLGFMAIDLNSIFLILQLSTMTMTRTCLWKQMSYHHLNIV